MSLFPYLPWCYGLSACYLLLLYGGGVTLSFRDIIVFLLSPITLPLSLFMGVLGGLFDLDSPCFQPPSGR